jgi:nitroreductase
MTAAPMFDASARLRERYRDPTQEVDGQGWNSTLDLLLAHRSIRHYEPRDVPEEFVEAIVAAAQSASTSSNLQTWSVVEVRDAERKARLAAIAAKQRHVVQAPVLLAFVVDLSRMRRLGKASAKSVDGLDYLESFLVGVVDAALAAQNAMTAAESLGLGCCYLGALRNDPAAVAA